MKFRYVQTHGVAWRVHFPVPKLDNFGNFGGLQVRKYRACPTYLLVQLEPNSAWSQFSSFPCFASHFRWFELSFEQADFLPFGFGVFNHSIPRPFAVPEERLLNVRTISTQWRYSDKLKLACSTWIIMILQRIKGRYIPSATSRYLATVCYSGTLFFCGLYPYCICLGSDCMVVFGFRLTIGYPKIWSLMIIFTLKRHTLGILWYTLFSDKPFGKFPWNMLVSPPFSFSSKHNVERTLAACLQDVFRLETKIDAVMKSLNDKDGSKQRWKRNISLDSS